MSPIKNLSERRRIPRLGKIHLGVMVETSKGVPYPKAVDYFVSPEAVQAAYGEKPTAFDVVFPIDDEEIIASQFYKAYSKSRGLVCRGDGMTASRLIDVATKQGEEGTGIITGDIATHLTKEVEWIEDIACPGQSCPYYQQKACRIIMNLQFLLPRLPGLGIWQLDTSSINSIVNINSALALVRSIFGTVAGIPLKLTLEPIEVSPDGKKKKVYVLNLRSEVTLAKLAEAHRKPLHALVPQPDDEMPDMLFPTTEQEAARAEDEKIEAQAQIQKDTDALYPKTVEVPIAEKVVMPSVAPAVEASDDPFAEPASPVPKRSELQPGIDLKWLRESLEKLQWTDVAKWLKERYKVAATQSIREMVLKLTFDQQREFAREVNIRLMEVIEHPNTKGKQ